MKPFTFLLALGCLLSSALASDQMRDVQTTLKKEGFYYGEVTGSENAETGAAIRRFQIRNGISVTGKLNGETLTAMGLGAKNARPVANSPAPAPAASPSPAAQLNPPAPAQIVPPDVARKAKPGVDAASDPAAAIEPGRLLRDGSAVVDPPTPIPAPVSTPTSIMFRGTPFADAPREVQQGMILRAQVVMAARRNYRGPLDGVAGPATSEAIFIYQAETGLRRSGRLDLETLTEMNLLPPRPPGGPLLKPFYNPNRRRDSSVTVDFWAR